MEAAPPTPAEQSGGSRGWRFYVAIAAVVLAAIFILQNSQEVDVKFFFSTTTIPLIFALLLAFAFGLVIGLVAPRFRGGGKGE